MAPAATRPASAGTTSPTCIDEITAALIIGARCTHDQDPAGPVYFSNNAARVCMGRIRRGESGKRMNPCAA